MSGLAIYMEGGGEGKDAKAALRQGMDRFLTDLKEATRAKSWNWKLVCCGSRNDAFEAFVNARRHRDFSIVALLVDAEEPVILNSCAHLRAREGWDMEATDTNVVHLMAETMETWIVSDVDTLAHFYGQNFNRNALPRAANLETIAKSTLARALHQATHRTQKGVYHKIWHAGALLGQINSTIVRQRCPNCDRMFRDLSKVIA